MCVGLSRSVCCKCLSIVYLFVCLTRCTYLLIYLCVCVFVCVCLSLSFWVCLCAFVCVCVHVSLSMYLSLPVGQTVCRSICMSVCGQFGCLPICVALWLGLLIHIRSSAFQSVAYCRSFTVCTKRASNEGERILRAMLRARGWERKATYRRGTDWGSKCRGDECWVRMESARPRRGWEQESRSA